MRVVGRQVSRVKGTLMSCFLAATRAYNVISLDTVLRSRSVICARSLKLYIVKSSGRAQTRQPRATRSRCCCRIKYHNAPGTSIGIRCNQFGKGPKAVACKSSLQGIVVAIPMKIKRRCVVNGQIRIRAFHTSLIFSGRTMWEFEKLFRETTVMLQMIQASKFSRWDTRVINLRLNNKKCIPRNWETTLSNYFTI